MNKNDLKKKKEEEKAKIEALKNGVNETFLNAKGYETLKLIKLICLANATSMVRDKNGVISTHDMAFREGQKAVWTRLKSFFSDELYKKIEGER